MPRPEQFSLASLAEFLQLCAPIFSRSVRPGDLLIIENESVADFRRQRQMVISPTASILPCPTTSRAR
jgi:hypothetical protein